MYLAKIGTTKDIISGRGGLTFFLRYIEETNLFQFMTNLLSPLFISNGKGLQLTQLGSFKLKMIKYFFLSSYK